MRSGRTVAVSRTPRSSSASLDFFRKTHADGFPGTNKSLKPIKYYALDNPHYSYRSLGARLRLWRRRRHRSPAPCDRTDCAGHAVSDWPPGLITGSNPSSKGGVTTSRGGLISVCSTETRASWTRWLPGKFFCRLSGPSPGDGFPSVLHVMADPRFDEFIADGQPRILR